jgi:hypothetical protein
LTERAYVDSSCFIAIALEEPGFEDQYLRTVAATYDRETLLA